MSIIPKKYDLEANVISAARNRIEAIAEHYRVYVLVPFCREHRLTYIAGNGVTVFYTKPTRRTPERSFGSADDAVLEGYPEAARIFAVLDQEGIGRNDCFGFYVRDVTAADIRRPPKTRK